MGSTRKPWETTEGWWGQTAEPDWWVELDALPNQPVQTEPTQSPSQPKAKRKKAPTSQDFAVLNRKNLGKAYARIYRAKLQEEAKAAGNCQICLKNPARPRQKDGLPSARCQACYDKYTTAWLEAHPYKDRRASRVRKSKKALGLCRQSGCTSVAIEGITKCGFHAEQDSERDLARYTKKKENHDNSPDSCFVCNNPLSGRSKRFCETHLEAHLSRQKRYRDNKNRRDQGGARCA